MARRGLPEIDFTRAARAAVAEPVDSLLSHAEGRVLDLSPTRQLDGEAVVWAPELRDEPRDKVFDTVVSVLRSTRERSVDAFAARLVRLVDPDDGRLLFVEPTRVSGVTGQVRRLWRPATEISSNLHLHEGFRLALWRAGLTVFQVDRYDLGRRAWPVAALAVGMARHTPADLLARR